MRASALIGVILIVLGLVSLAFAGITYTKRETIIDVGPIHATAERQKTIPLPPVIGVAALVGGVVLLVTSRK